MRSLWLGCLVLGACAGPIASDVSVCQDLIHRLCIDPVCPSVSSAFGINARCEQTLLTNTNCSSPSFAFTTVTRDRVLSCRAPLLHAGDDVDTHPDCGDVSTFVSSCPNVVSFLRGGL